MMGLEPTTFCMARLTGRHTGTVSGHFHDAPGRNRPRLSPSVPVACYPGRCPEAGLERVPHPGRLRLRIEQVSVDPKGHRRVRMPELAGDEHNIGALPNQHARERVAKIVRP
jgi:hypothetical protein